MNDAVGPAVPGTAELLRAVRGWCAADGMDVVVDKSGTQASVRCDGVELELDTIGGVMVVRHRFTIPSGVFTWAIPGMQAAATPTLADVVARVIDSRWGPLRGSAQPTATGSQVTLECAVDGGDMSRGSFRAATLEVVKTRRVIDRLVADDEAQRAALAGVIGAGQSPGEAGASATAVAGGPDGGASPRTNAGTPRMRLGTTHAAAPGQAPSAGGWVPTHVVPPGGAATWAEPDPDAPATARLDAGLSIGVAERRGDWARIVCENGWSAWVDARRLQPLS